MVPGLSCQQAKPDHYTRSAARSPACPNATCVCIHVVCVYNPPHPPALLLQIVNTQTGNVAKGCELLLFAHDHVYLQQVPRKVPHI